MTGQDLLETLLARIAAASDGTVFVAAEEMAAWPKTAVSVLKAEGLLLPASPATSVVCDGCEWSCAMPVEISHHRTGNAAFVACDKRDDIGRVEVPLGRLERWQSSGEAVAIVLAQLLGTRRASGSSSRERWSVGVLRDKRAADVTLAKRGTLTLEMAGREVRLDHVLKLRARAMTIDRPQLIDLVNNPATGGASSESGARRAVRLAAEYDQLRDGGVRNPRTVLAEKEGCSVETIKKLLGRGRRLRAAPSREQALR